MRILAIGGAGFIGSAFVRSVVAERLHEVLVLDNLTYARNGTALAPCEGSPYFRFVLGDICKSTAVRELLGEFRPNAVINFAAETHVDCSIDGPSDFIQTNIVGTSVLLESCLGYWRGLGDTERNRFRYLQVSTDEVFGALSLGDPPFSEESPMRPSSPYSASKA